MIFRKFEILDEHNDVEATVAITESLIHDKYLTVENGMKGDDYERVDIPLELVSDFVKAVNEIMKSETARDV